MKRNYVMMAMAAAMLASCAQTGLVEEIAEEPQKAIGFSTFVDKATRAGENSTKLNDFYPTFNVYGWKSIDGGANWQDVFNNVTNEYFTSDVAGSEVYTSGKPSKEWTVSDPFTKSWYYEGIRYWDKLATHYQFCAYTPIIATGEVAATPEGEIKIGTETALITVDGKNLQASPTDALIYTGFNCDYMTAVSTIKNTEVNLEFTHELAKLNVKVKKDDSYKSSQTLYVSTLEILNLKNQGYFVRNATPSKTWTVPTSSTEGTFAMGSGNRDLANPGTDNGKFVIEQLLLPQNIERVITDPLANVVQSSSEFNDKACVHITYVIGNEQFDGYYALNNIFNKNADYTFEGGKEYTLTITIGPEPIHFTPSVTEWTEGTGSYTIE